MNAEIVCARCAANRKTTRLVELVEDPEDGWEVWVPSSVPTLRRGHVEHPTPTTVAGGGPTCWISPVRDLREDWSADVVCQRHGNRRVTLAHVRAALAGPRRVAQA